MSLDNKVRIRVEIPGRVVVTDQGSNVATQGESEEQAKTMFEDAFELYNGNGKQIRDQDLANFGLSPDDLDTEPLPNDFDQFSIPDVSFDPKTIATVLMRHGFRPVAHSEQHIQLIDMRNNINHPIIIPIHEDSLDAFISGFIGGLISEPDVEPNYVLGWFEENA